MPDLATVSTMAVLAANGATTRTIEAQVGYDHTTVSRALHTPPAKAIIEAIQARIINEAITQGADNIIHAVTSYKSIPPNGEGADPQLREHGYKASMELLRSIGILPSHSTSVFIQQIFQGSRVPQVIVDILAHITRRDGDPAGNLLAEDDVIDLPGSNRG
jgi:hypothetical protein